jgi:hypothetical protein
MTAVTTGGSGLKVGTPALISAGALAFGPGGILFVADYAAATIYAVDLGDVAPAADGPVEIAGLDARIASLLGVGPDHVRVRGIAVHPGSRAVYLSVTRGHGDDAIPVLVRVSGDDVAEVDLTDVPFDRIVLDDAPAVEDERTDARVGIRPEPGSEAIHVRDITLYVKWIPLRTSAITDLAWVGDALLVAGASKEEFSSTLRRIPFPFKGDVASTSLEIFHVSHGKYETASPIRSFVTFGDGRSILASYSCTPVVQFRIADLVPGAQAKGSTVAELGFMNQPLDMVAYRRDGEEYLLVSNSRHPLLKLPAAPIADQAPLREPIPEQGETAGVPGEALPHPGVTLMANLGSDRVVFVHRDEAGGLALRSYGTAEL